MEGVECIVTGYGIGDVMCSGYGIGVVVGSGDWTGVECCVVPNSGD